MFFRFLSLLVSCFFVSVLFRFFPSVFCFFVVVVVVYFFVLYFLFVFPCLFFSTFFIIIFFYAVIMLFSLEFSKVYLSE